MDISSKVRRAAGAALAVGVAAFVLAPAGPAVAGGSHTVTDTQTFHGVQPFDEFNPCTGDELIGTESSNVVNHVTSFTDGDEAWGTFTEVDRISAVDQQTGVGFTGRSTVWGNFNLNNQNSNDTFTGSVRATGSDGSVVTFHEVMHETLTPGSSVPVVSFDRPTMTCGT
jgi:hypothetical protein